MSLGSLRWAGLSASPVNSAWHAGRLADGAELVLDVDDLASAQLEPGLVELRRRRTRSGRRRRAGPVGENGLPTLSMPTLPSCGLELRRLELGNSCVDRGLALGRVEALALRRGEDEVQHGALLGRELRLDQVGGLLGVGARDLELVLEAAADGRTRERTAVRSTRASRKSPARGATHTPAPSARAGPSRAVRAPRAVRTDSQVRCRVLSFELPPALISLRTPRDLESHRRR